MNLETNQNLNTLFIYPKPQPQYVQNQAQHPQTIPHYNTIKYKCVKILNQSHNIERVSFLGYEFVIEEIHNHPQNIGNLFMSNS